MGLFLSKLRGLRRDERASIMPLFLFLLIMFAVALVYLIDSGLAIRRKINLQQAADSAAVSQAQWTARSLNILSMNNVAQSQLYTTWAIAFSMDTYLNIALAKPKAIAVQQSPDIVSAGVACAKAIAAAPATLGLSALAGLPPCAAEIAMIAYGATMGGLSWDVSRIRSDYRFHEGADYSAAAIRAIRSSNRYILDQDKHQARLGYISFDAVKAHVFGDNIYTFGGDACSSQRCIENQYPKGAEIPAIPAAIEELSMGSVDNALAMTQFCTAMDFGSQGEFVRRGYARNVNSNWRGWETNRGPWWRAGRAEEYYKFINRKTNVGTRVGRLDDMIRWVTLPRWPDIADIRSAGQEISLYNKWPDGDYNPNQNRNTFLWLVETIDKIYCGPGNTGAGATLINSASAGDFLGGDGSVISQLESFLNSIVSFLNFPDFAVPEPVALKGGADFLNSVVNQGSVGLGALYSSQDMNVLTIVRAEGGGKNVLGGNGGAIPSYAYAQAQIYNPTAPDLYTQDWNARLVHASILSGRVDSALGGIGPISSILGGDKRANVRDVLNEMRTQAGPGFTPFIEAYEDISSAYSDQGNASETWGDTFVN